MIFDFVPDAEALRFEEQLEELRRQHEQIRGMIEEARQKNKIELPPYPAWTGK